MHAAVRFLLIASAVLVYPGFVAAQEPEVLVELGRDRIFEGESVRYTVTLNHCEDTVRPTLPKLADMQIREAGVTVVRQTVFDGFKRTSIGGPRYEYVLTPQRGGDFSIPRPSVTVDGKTYQGEAVTLQVVGPSEQDLAILETSVSDATVYPLQPFKMRVTVALKAMPDPYSAEDPLRGAGDIPVLIIPWADDDSLPEGVKPDSPALRWLNGYLTPSRRTVGFGINNLRLGRDDLFSVFTEQQRAMFRPEPKTVKRKDSRGATADYWEYVFERTLTASKIGNVSLGRITLKGSFAHRANPSGGVDTESVYAVANPVELTVQDVPADGRPDSYIGAVGQFEIDAELTPTTAKVGDPLTFSLRVHGEGVLDNAFAPKLDQNPEVAKGFRVYEASEESAEDEKTFSYNLRPLQAGLKEFPPVEVSYFDVESERFITLKTPPIKIEVAESDRLADRDIAIAAPAPGRAQVFEATNDGIFANISDLQTVVDERVHFNWWIITLGGMATAFLAASLVAKQVRHRRNDPSHLRRRNAIKRAQTFLDQAKQHLANGSRRDSIDAMRSAITGLVADVMDRSETSLTARDVSQHLSQIGVSTDIVDRCSKWLDDLDAARYGETSHALESLLQKGSDLLDELVRELRQRKLAA